MKEQHSEIILYALLTFWALAVLFFLGMAIYFFLKKQREDFEEAIGGTFIAALLGITTLPMLIISGLIVGFNYLTNDWFESKNV